MDIKPKATYVFLQAPCYLRCVCSTSKILYAYSFGAFIIPYLETVQKVEKQQTVKTFSIFTKSRNKVKILGAKMVASDKYQAEKTHILGATGRPAARCVSAHALV